MVFTGSHKAFQSDKYITYAISGNRGKDANYQGKCYPDLAPKLSFWKIWHDNIGKISEEENNKYYIEEYYKEVLSKLDPQKVYDELDNSILLCYEDTTEFCHRHIVAAWFELLLDVEVPELEAKDYETKFSESKRPEYIKNYLEELLKREKNMRGFTSLRALYLFEKGEEAEALADKLEKETGKCQDHFRQEACYLRCEADMAEDLYRAKIYKKQ